MDVIELECPHCGDALELDAAFAGGVCRCSTCGTLMTVPADPSRDRAETLTRRDRPDSPDGGRAETPGGRPDSPGGRPARPDVPGGRPETPGGAPADRPGPGSQGADLAALANAGPAESVAPASDDLYITSSGKALHLAAAVVPTARKRKKVIRATVIAGFVAFVLVVVGVIIFAINMLFNQGKPKTTEVPDIVGIDPAVNPIKNPEANLLTIPIGAEVGLIVDATTFARQWYSQMSEIVAHEVSLSATTDYMIIPWTDLNPKSFPGTKPGKIDSSKLQGLKDFLAVANVGSTSPAPFVELALSERADQIILVTGRMLEEEEVAAVREAIAKRVDTRFDAVVIDGHDEALQKLAKENKGKYVSLKVDQLQTWFDEWKKGG